MDYFPHDVHLASDKKVQALRIIHGNDGYTFFCIMLEMIYQEPNFELLVSDAETIQILARNVEVTPQKFSDMLQTALKHGCFDRARYESDGVLTSDGIKKRAEVVVKKRESMRGSRENKVSGGVSDAETIPQSTQSKVKESNSKVKALQPITDSDECDKAFEEWYSIYPKQGSVRKTALDKWRVLWKAKKIDMQKMVQGTQSYIAYQNHHQYKTCAATVFLNQERWLSDWNIVTRGANQGAINRGRTENLNAGIDFGF
jgi:hypothetical protein